MDKDIEKLIEQGDWIAFKLSNGYENCGRVTRVCKNGVVYVYSFLKNKTHRCRQADCFIPDSFTNRHRLEVMIETKRAHEDAGMDASRLF